MGQIDRDYWYEPKVFRGTKKSRAQSIEKLFEGQLETKGSRHSRSPDVTTSSWTWHWLEFIMGIGFCIGVVLAFPIQVFTVVQQILELVR